MVNSCIKRFLNYLYRPDAEIANVPKLKMYMVLPFFGSQSEKLRKELTSTLSRFYTYVDFNIVLVNNYTIGSLFRFKDRIPVSCQSSVVYQYRCASCDASYIGSTKRTLHCRIEQHAGRSFRTGKKLTNPDHSAIRSHSEKCSESISEENFKIIGRESNAFDLRVLESLHILGSKPNLNDNTGSAQFYVVA